MQQQQQNVPLSRLTTMRLGGPARSVVTVRSVGELVDTVTACRAGGGQPFFVMGGGSNVIARDQGFPGTIILNRITGIEVVADDRDSTTIRAGAGEVWDDVVARTAEMNLSGIEALSAIPGTAGATPVQNVGAYGQEIADTLVELDALDTRRMQPVRLARADCGLSYRNSIFKDPARRQHIITSVTLRLRKARMTPPFYPSLQGYFDNHGISDFSPANVRRAVIALRRTRLPDPARIPNCGSFFKNPIVPTDLARRLAAAHPDLPRYPAGAAGTKLAAGWLIEHAGLKGYASHGFATSPDNALVVVNRSAQTHAALERFKQEIVDTVYRRYGVLLEQEPETL